jgi:RepB DNA-primase from phage plasmid
VLDEVISTRAAKILAARFGGDLGSADWRHFGRLAGFPTRSRIGGWNRGCSPLRGCLRPADWSIRNALAFIAAVKTSIKDEAAIVRGGDPEREGEGGDPMPPLRPLAEFHSDARYA